MEAPPPAMLLIAPSVRAAAESLRRAGYQGIIAGVDLFGDVDTRRYCDAWFHLTNPPPLRNALEISEIHVVGGGVDRSTLARWNDAFPGACTFGAHDNFCPTFLASLCLGIDIDFPETHFHRPRIPATPGSWLVKPIRGSGGIGIADLDRASPTNARVIYQRRIEGKCYGITFHCLRHSVFGRNVTLARYVGSTLSQIRGRGPNPYGYAGSEGPVSIGEHGDAVCEIANRFAAAHPDLTCFNIDIVVDQHRCWLLEINDRYSASMEIHERLGRYSLLLRNDIPASQSSSYRRKRIYYADCEQTFVRSSVDVGINTDVCDFPVDGTVFKTHHPMFTTIDEEDPSRTIPSPHRV